MEETAVAKALSGEKASQVQGAPGRDLSLMKNRKRQQMASERSPKPDLVVFCGSLLELRILSPT